MLISAEIRWFRADHCPQVYTIGFSNRDYHQAAGIRGLTDMRLRGMRLRLVSRNGVKNRGLRSKGSSRREQLRSSNRSQRISKYGANGPAQFLV
jgi:hypothetical protein